MTDENFKSDLNKVVDNRSRKMDREVGPIVALYPKSGGTLAPSSHQHVEFLHPKSGGTLTPSSHQHVEFLPEVLRMFNDEPPFSLSPETKLPLRVAVTPKKPGGNTPS